MKDERIGAAVIVVTFVLLLIVAVLNFRDAAAEPDPTEVQVVDPAPSGTRCRVGAVHPSSRGRTVSTITCEGQITRGEYILQPAGRESTDSHGPRGVA